MRVERNRADGGLLPVVTFALRLALVCAVLLPAVLRAQEITPAEIPAAADAPGGDVAEPGAVESSGDATQDSAEVPPPPVARVVLVATQVIAVDPVVGRFVNEQLVRTATELGYQVVQGEETARFAQQVTLPYPPPPADLWRLTYASGSQRGVFARVWAEGGNYVTEVLVASLDGAGPFVQRAPSGAADLQAVVHTLLTQTLPPPAAQMTAPAPTAPAPTTPALPGLLPGTPVAAAELEEPIGPRWNLAFQTESAFGLGDNSFYNHLLGARIDYKVSRDVLTGFYLGYANLKGRSGRVGNTLLYAQLEDRVRVTRDGKVTVPLRLALGYLPRNGPVLRLASGVFYAVSPTLSLGAEALAPTFWVIRDRVLFSMDFAVELSLAL